MCNIQYCAVLTKNGTSPLSLSFFIASLIQEKDFPLFDSILLYIEQSGTIWEYRENLLKKIWEIFPEFVTTKTEVLVTFKVTKRKRKQN